MTKMTPAELDNAFLSDIRSDMEVSLEQAENGPFYPEKGITPDSLRAYAEKCRAILAKYENGGGHKAAISGEAFA